MDIIPKLVLGGIPLELARIDDTTPLPSWGGRPRNSYAIRVISLTGEAITDRRSFSTIWDGITVMTRMDRNTGLFYLPYHSDISVSQRGSSWFATSRIDTIPCVTGHLLTTGDVHSELMYHGVPLGLGQAGQLLFSHSGIRLSEINNFIEVKIGGNVISVGVKEGKNYLLVRDDSPVITMEFRSGISPFTGYRGFEDTYIDSSYPFSNFAKSPLLSMRSRYYHHGIFMRWDLSEICPGAKIISASLTLTHRHMSNPYLYINRVTSSLRIPETTWRESSRGTRWRRAGALSVYDTEKKNYWLNTKRIRRGISLSGSDRVTSNFAFNRNGILSLQQWISGQKKNQGIVMRLGGRHTGEAKIDSSESREIFHRPKLIITYKNG
jgi:hypothetical protein